MEKNKKIMIASFLIASIVFTLLTIFIIKNNNVYYNVDFKTNGGSIVKSQKLKKNEKVRKPDNPVKEGYVFSYWQLEGKEYDFNKKVNKNIVLKAKWIKEELSDEITVKFDTNGGSFIPDLIIQKNLKITKPSDPQKEGFIFKGWLVDGELYDFENIVKSDIMLVASWEEEVNTAKMENNKTTTKRNIQSSNSNEHSQNSNPNENSQNNVPVTTTRKPEETRPVPATTTVPTTKAVQYSYKWVDVAGSTIGQSDLYIINKDTGSIVSGIATITYQNGASETVSITTSGKRFVKSAVMSVSNVKGN